MKLSGRQGVVAFAAIAAALLVWGFWPQPVMVDAGIAVRGPLRVSVTEEGRTRVRERYVVAAPVSGLLRRIGFEVGDAVRAGQVLAQIAPSPSVLPDSRVREQDEARVAAATAALEAARADAEFARGELVRIRALHEARVVAQRELDLAENRDRAAGAAVAVARHDLESAHAALRHAGVSSGEQVAVVSPVDGVVLALARKSEAPVFAGEPLVEVGDPRGLEVEVDVLSADAVRITPGARVLLHRWGGEGVIEAQVRAVEPAGFTKISALGVEEQRVLVIADLEGDPGRWSRLGHGYRVEAEFVLWESDGVLQVPASAVFRLGDGWAVFAVEDGRARLRRVEPGQRNGLAAEILGGLDAGAVVVVHPERSLTDGQRVEPRG